jgi:hypothetical protein
MENPVATPPVSHTRLHSHSQAQGRGWLIQQQGFEASSFLLQNPSGWDKKNVVPQFPAYIRRCRIGLLRIVCTQLRRIFAIRADERVVAERKENEDNSIGY